MRVHTPFHAVSKQSSVAHRGRRSGSQRCIGDPADMGRPVKNISSSRYPLSAERRSGAICCRKVEPQNHRITVRSCTCFFEASTNTWHNSKTRVLLTVYIDSRKAINVAMNGSRHRKIGAVQYFRSSSRSASCNLHRASSLLLRLRIPR
jgi:hypothetical protein